MNTTIQDTLFVNYNEWPNPMWNTTPYEWDAVYEPLTPEWFAQQTAKNARRIGLEYTLVDKYEQYKKKPFVLDAPDTMTTHEPDASTTQAPTTHEPRAGLAVKNGVLTDEHVFIMHEGKLRKIALPYPIENAGHIMQMCLDYCLDMIAVLAPTTLSTQATQDFIESARGSWDVSRAQYTRKKMCYFLSGYKKKEVRADHDTGNTISVFYAAHNTDWNMHNVTDPITLLAALTYIEDALGYPVRYKPSHVGRMIMVQENEGQRKEWVRPVHLIDNPIVCKASVQPLLWKRPLTPQEHSHEYALAYDKNMQHTATCTGVLLGSGQEKHITRPTFDMKKTVIGVWHCTISGTSEFDGVSLPHPTDGKMSGWFWTYSVKLLHELGYTVDIEEAYIWEESHTILRPFGVRMWDARNALRSDVTRYPHSVARGIAETSVKSCANSAMGMFEHSPKNTDSLTAYDWFRPDWWWLILDYSRYQMFWRMRTYLNYGYSPIGIDTDCLYYTSNDSNHETALVGTTTRKGQEIPCSMTDRAHELGGYKQKHKSIILTRAYIETLFNDASLDMPTINMRLLTYEKEARTE